MSKSNTSIVRPVGTRVADILKLEAIKAVMPSFRPWMEDSVQVRSAYRSYLRDAASNPELQGVRDVRDALRHAGAGSYWTE